MTKLRPFGSGSKKTSLKAFGSKPGKSASPRSTTSATITHPSKSSSRPATVARKPKLAGKPWHERLAYLVQRGYVIIRQDNFWLICDRFSNVQDDEPVFDNPIDAQKHADNLNNDLFQLRLKELTGRV